GKGGEGRAVPYFMLRIRIPNGIVTSAQLRVLADLAERHARGIADLTVRQNVQLHWVRIEDLPAVLSALGDCGLGSLGTCGDVTRNITGCALAGLDADEIVDASPLVHAATAMVNGSPEFYNLPRKYKISITGCRVWCSYPEINDLGLTAVRDVYSGHVGYSLRVGGGLSTQPHLAPRLDAFVRPDQVLAVVKGVSEIFRDSDVLRQNREKARLKFLFLDHGWTPDRFLTELEVRLGFRLAPGVAETLPEEAYRDHVGIHPQKQAGLVYAGLPILRGRLTPPEMRGLAGLADRFGTGELRATTMQNLVVVNVPRGRAAQLGRELHHAGFRLDASPFRRGTVACTGSEFCKLALTETKGFARRLVEDLEERLPGFQEHVRINITGCPNSCGQHWIADIGIEGKKVKVDGRLVDAYYFCVGGAVGKHQVVARPIGYRIPAPEVAGAVERLLRAYLAERRPGQSFRAFCARHTDDDLRAFLAGAEVAAVARDASPGPVPHGLDG
ncbi:MAG: nitrite/sulfite reductase, partial [Candidatus Rokuibacteriota bacterium]